MSSCVDFRGIRKVYHSAQGDVEAVSGFDLTVEPGSFVSIVGPSGCGKSTILQIVAGLADASGGEVLVDGRRVTEPPKEAIYLFQQYTKSVFPWKTVFENVALGLRYRKGASGNLGPEAVRERCQQMLDLVGLQSFSNHYPYQLSGGMQQRVAIARALVCRPEVLLMDEPFSAVDALTRTGLQDGLLELWMKLRPTVIFVTHDIDEAIYLSERVVVLSRAPSRVSQCVDINIPFPRDQIASREHPAVLGYRRQILADIMARAQSPTSDSRSGRRERAAATRATGG